MIALKEKVTFEMFALDFHIPLQKHIRVDWSGLISVLLIAALLSYQ